MMTNEMFTTLPTETIQGLVGSLAAYVYPEVSRAAAKEMGMDDEEMRTNLHRTSSEIIAAVVADLESGRAESFPNPSPAPSFGTQNKIPTGETANWAVDEMTISVELLMKVTYIAIEMYTTIKEQGGPEDLLGHMYTVIDSIVSMCKLHGELIGQDNSGMGF